MAVCLVQNYLCLVNVNLNPSLVFIDVPDVPFQMRAVTAVK